jgi:hypothetical protein
MDPVRNAARLVGGSVVARTGRARAEWTLHRVARSDGPLIAGPWLSEIGFELLYWRPLLEWFVRRHGIAPERLVAISRGGAEPWYVGLAGTYRDALDYLSPEELRSWHARREGATGTQKQTAPSALERTLLERVRDELGAPNAAVLHPGVMYELFRWFWAGRRPVRDVARRTEYRPFASSPPEGAAGLEELPEDFVALKVYFSRAFPDTDANRAFLHDLVRRLGDTRDVVLLSTGVALDEHLEWMPEGARVHRVEHLMSPRTNLAVQTEIVRRARALVATYGGFSYLGPFAGVPSVSFYSDANFAPMHLEVMRLAVEELGRRGPRAGAVVLDVRDARLLEVLAAPEAVPVSG